MIVLNLELDPTRACREDIHLLLTGGQLIRASGILNAKWNDFTALELCSENIAFEVKWDIVRDDTPSALELTILYFCADCENIHRLINATEGVETFDIETSD